MKRNFTILLIFTLCCKIAYSQTSTTNLVKSIFLPIDTVEITLRNNGIGDFLATLLNLHRDYEFRIQTIEETKEPERETDDLGYVHERYDLYYKKH